jgi:hypothetical protein
MDYTSQRAAYTLQPIVIVIRRVVPMIDDPHQDLQFFLEETWCLEVPKSKLLSLVVALKQNIIHLTLQLLKSLDLHAL